MNVLHWLIPAAALGGADGALSPDALCDIIGYGLARQVHIVLGVQIARSDPHRLHRFRSPTLIASIALEV